MSAARASPTPEPVPDFCDNPGCRQKFDDYGRRIEDLEKALRAPEHGIFDTLKRLELQFVTFTTTVTASVKTTVFIGSAGGGVLGAVVAALAIAAFFSSKGHP